MKIKFLLISSLLLAMFLAACGSQASPAVNTAVSEASQAAPTVESAATELAPTVQSAIQDLDSLVAAFQTAGMTVELGGPVDQTFFKVQGQSLKVNGGDVQVYVYDTAEAMEADASQVAADGSSIGTNMVDWVATPHFFKTGPVLVLYLGDDQTVLDLLKNILGPQFAGR